MKKLKTATVGMTGVLMVLGAAFPAAAYADCYYEWVCNGWGCFYRYICF